MSRGATTTAAAVIAKCLQAHRQRQIVRNCNSCKRCRHGAQHAKGCKGPQIGAKDIANYVSSTQGVSPLQMNSACIKSSGADPNAGSVQQGEICDAQAAADEMCDTPHPKAPNPPNKVVQQVQIKQSNQPHQHGCAATTKQARRAERTHAPTHTWAFIAAPVHLSRGRHKGCGQT